MKYLLQWGEAPEYCYEESFEKDEDALAFLNSFDIQWNTKIYGHWYKLYKEVFCATQSEWKHLQDYRTQYDKHS